ncbi:peptidoglycan editing factor PgeF [Anoxynatronum buryatiense]|uniref:Purine nucleoside phosphorylase n=1 Tax=Anoxynatronum buryatiense TaxID=489973 RepID=A0AA45WU56_9CLOT|nr:peptidoglycan editing factor PgeF [Anoxynatronum buryatiense]SMP44663.1 conserved hypothetical protein [Anoxynatronum buryatiense]
MESAHQHFLWRETSGVTYGYFPAFEATGIVNHGFSTRLGGVSTGSYETMNLAYNSGDHPGHVTENYRRFTGALGVDWQLAVLTHQTHETCIRQVTRQDAGKGLAQKRDYSHVDALITNEPGIPLMTFHADCVPLYILDPVNKAIGLGHAGWRGTVSQLAVKLVQEMTAAYGSKPRNLLAAIGPAIDACCYLIREDVYSSFREKLPLADTSISPVNDQQWRLSLPEINRQLFMQAGIMNNRIIQSQVCTCCHASILFSHRAHGQQRGTMAALMQLNGK